MNIRILRKIRKEFNYLEYLETHCEVKYTPDKEIRICCPSCDDYKFKCYVNNEKKKFHCFKCGFSSGKNDVFDLISKVENVTRAKAMLKASREYAEVTEDWSDIIKSCKVLEVEEFEPRSIRHIDSVPGELLVDKNDDLQAPFWSYLSSRGLTDNEITSIKFRYVKDQDYPLLDENGKYRGNLGRRVLIPVYGGNHKLVSWVSRSIDPNEEFRYLNCPSSDINMTLWPFVKPTDSVAVLVEGCFDSIAVRRLNLNVYATLGKHISKEQIRLLKDWNIKHVVLFWDKRDAFKQMVKAVDSLVLHFDTVYVPDFTNWPSEKDTADTMVWEEGYTLLDNIFSNGLIDVNTMNYTKWKLQGMFK